MHKRVMHEKNYHIIYMMLLLMNWS